jgi:hypothetical protein
MHPSRSRLRKGAAAAPEGGRREQITQRAKAGSLSDAANCWIVVLVCTSSR